MVSDDVPSFELTHPASGRLSRLVFASPHSGLWLPSDMMPTATLSLDSLNSACDVAIDQFLAASPDLGVPLVTGRVSRAYVDLNRAPTEIDPEMVSDAPADLEVGPKTRAGYGVVPRLTGDGQRLYDRALTMAEVRGRLEQVHAPYHAALSGLMRQTHAQHGRAILIDWHSMPGRATGISGVDVVLGDRYGSACDPELTRQLRALFEGLGWKVALNHPYAGGYSTQVWGQPDQGYEAIQIELSRRLYWDEARGEPAVGWRRCQSGLNRVLKGLIAAYQADAG